jgi:transposase-like protein
MNPPLMGMTHRYPVELRIRAVNASVSGEDSLPEVAARFVIGEATLKK